ncbi:hypothetical protein [Lacinutrix algicola]|uniref:hypothetical protein n=1 Tax=Lacinutrix algicola TaxID=342954 RepID=UPI0006E26B67|nr:hypothetical protein [Lacinutrix algicola]
MKTLMKNTLVLAMIFATLISNATELTSLNNEEDGKTTLVLENVSQGDMLLVKDAYGIILYREAILENGKYNKSFDLTTLPNGSYIFELDKKADIRVYPFTVNSKTVTFDKESLKVIYKPRIKTEDQMITVNTYNPTKSNYSINIYYDTENDSYEKIYSETVNDTSIIAKKYTLLKDRTGDYKIEITVNDRTFTSFSSL